MKNIGVVVENHLNVENNAFKIFEIEYKFYITLETLNKRYFELYKQCYNKEKINEAYAILKDDMKRADLLCKIYGYTAIDKFLPKKIIEYFAFDKIKLENIKYETIVAIKNNATNENWEQTWYLLQKLSYIERLLSNIIRNKII